MGTVAEMMAAVGIMVASEVAATAAVVAVATVVVEEETAVSIAVVAVTMVVVGIVVGMVEVGGAGMGVGVVVRWISLRTSGWERGGGGKPMAYKNMQHGTVIDNYMVSPWFFGMFVYVYGFWMSGNIFV